MGTSVAGPWGQSERPKKPLANKVGLPARPFLYTPDQIAQLLSLTTGQVLRNYLWFEDRNVGPPDKDRLLARNIAGPGDDPEWRVSEQELIRWMRRKGFQAYEYVWVR